MNTINPDLAICICTYRRTSLLMQLVEDIFTQTIVPKLLIIVDGSPDGESLAALKGMQFPESLRLVYIPSNHPNLSYQRYLGRLATGQQISYLLFLDDDLRLEQKDAIERLQNHLITSRWNAGVTSILRMGTQGEEFASHPALLERSKPIGGALAGLIQRWGSAHGIPPGGLTPTGDRVLPESDGGHSEVEWLRGGVMLFRMEALSKDCFSDDLFALDHIRCGKGEDTILSRRVMKYGKLIRANDVIIDHPNSDLPKTYPISAYELAYATAYSRRFLNDHYRITRPPEIRDRLALLNSYFGNILLNFGRALTGPAWHRLAYAFGYFIGSLRGLIQAPTAKSLTPDIDWWADAELALKEQVCIQCGA